MPWSCENKVNPTRAAGNSDQSIVRQRHPFRQLRIDGIMEAQLVADVGETFGERQF